MSASREHTRSIWMDIDVFPRAPLLDRDLTADTVVVGSGIAGLSTAYELSLLGQKVVVLDRGPIGGGGHRSRGLRPRLLPLVQYP